MGAGKVPDRRSWRWFQLRLTSWWMGYQRSSRYPSPSGLRRPFLPLEAGLLFARPLPEAGEPYASRVVSTETSAVQFTITPSARRVAPEARDRLLADLGFGRLFTEHLG